MRRHAAEVEAAVSRNHPSSLVLGTDSHRTRFESASLVARGSGSGLDVSLSVERRRGRERSRGGFGQKLGFAPVNLGKFNEGGALVHARGQTWGRLIFQNGFKKEQ
jgi:hypothetical protein